MNTQGAYKKLDLAKGLNRDRIDAQYQELKSELELKITSTQNERLKQVYVNRLTEVEEAYKFLVDHFESNNDAALNGPDSVNPSPDIHDVPVNSELTSKRKKKFIIASVAIGILLIGLIFMFGPSIFGPKEEIDLFRKMEGEKQIFVNNLTLRQYPDSESSKIEVFPFSTRLIFDESETSTTDNKHRTWRKVRVIHPVYGWDRPDEKFPYPYEGWMAIDECGVDWLEDSLQTSNLSRILGNEDAGRSVTSIYRHALSKHFDQYDYFDTWLVYGSNKRSNLQKVLLVNFGNSEDDCNGSKQYDFIALLKNPNSGEQKLIVLSADVYGGYSVMYDNGLDNSINGLRKLSTRELRSFNRYNNFNARNAVYLGESGYLSKALTIINEKVVIRYF